jgi:hypothetical protein
MVTQEQFEEDCLFAEKNAKSTVTAVSGSILGPFWR